MSEIQPQPVNEPHPGHEAYIKGFKYLLGVGVEKNHGMAIASMLDSSDLEYPPAYLACALMYFTGTGITRNTETASEFAAKFVLFSPGSKHAKSANEIQSGSLGTQNASKLLAELSKEVTSTKPSASPSGPPTANEAPSATVKKTNIKLIGGVGAAAIVALGAVVFLLFPSAGGDLSLAPPQSFDLKNVFSEEELKISRQKALEEAGFIRTQARTKATAGK